MKIREFNLKDYPQVFALWEESGLHTGRSDTFESIKVQIKRDPDLFLVAEEDGNIVGVVLGRFDGRRGWLNRLAVAPGSRNGRLGSRLVAEVEKRLIAKGCEKLNLVITPDNVHVQPFYEKLGYTLEELIFMEKWLV
ncbi:MAG TPA: GNAT family acetyltransferase [Dehalococcoidales bacterium]|nr:GNAT family acetyltransferase [Dehalococcoidales bacterium]